MVTSNRVVQDWDKYLGDAQMETTILDRLIHRPAMLEFEGKSFRLTEAVARLASTPVTAYSDSPFVEQFYLAIGEVGAGFRGARRVSE